MQLLKYRDKVYRIIGAAMEVHRCLNYGLLEAVYQEALAMELKSIGIDSKSEETIEIFYKGQKMQKTYRIDLMVDDIIVELKSTNNINASHRAQLCNYLRLTHKPLGLLINFGEPSIHGERWAYDEQSNRCYLLDKYLQPVPDSKQPLVEQDTE